MATRKTTPLPATDRPRAGGRIDWPRVLREACRLIERDCSKSR